jgi:hypothetical protein
MKILKLSAKCSDMCNLTLSERLPHGGDGPIIGEADGYVPEWLPGPNVQHYGDYVILDIDVATGQILNWKPPTKKQLAETFNSKSV